MQTSLVRRLGGVAAAALALWASTASAQAPWPSQPIRMIVPQGTGGGVDTMGRVLARELSTALGQPVIVENKPGGAANIGADFVAKAPADGYTFLYGFQTIATTNPHLYAKLPFNALTDLMPVTQTMAGGYLLAVNNNVPVRTLPELVAYAKKDPGKVAYGTYGPGSAHHLMTELLQQAAGIQLLHVPYKQTPSVDLMAGHIQMMFDAAGVMQELVRAGKVRAIAVSTPQRMPQFPDVPTLAETYPGFEVTGWQGIWVPKGTPPAVIERLNKEVVRIMHTPTMVKVATDFTAQVTATTPAEMQAIIVRENKQWGDIIRAKGIKLE